MQPDPLRRHPAALALLLAASVLATTACDRRATDPATPSTSASPGTSSGSTGSATDTSGTGSGVGTGGTTGGTVGAGAPPSDSASTAMPPASAASQ